MFVDDEFDDLCPAEKVAVMQDFASKLGVPKDEAFAVLDAMFEPDKDFARMKLDRLRKKARPLGH